MPIFEAEHTLALPVIDMQMRESVQRRYKLHHTLIDVEYRALVLAAEIVDHQTHLVVALRQIAAPVVEYASIVNREQQKSAKPATSARTKEIAARNVLMSLRSLQQIDSAQLAYIVETIRARCVELETLCNHASLSAEVRTTIDSLLAK